MPINFSEQAAVVVDTASVEDAEVLMAWLQGQPHGVVDLSACSHLHAACLQALMLAGARTLRAPADPALAGWLRATLTLMNEETIAP